MRLSFGELHFMDVYVALFLFGRRVGHSDVQPDDRHRHCVGYAVLQHDKLFKETNEEYKHIVRLGLMLSLIVGIAGAFLLDAYTQGVSVSFSNLRRIGLTFYGGLMVGLFGLILYLKLRSQRVSDTLNLLTMPFCLIHAFGRMGCFWAGCCFGKPSDSWLGIRFPENSLPCTQSGQCVPVYPTQLFESGFVFLLFFLFLYSNLKAVRENRWLIYLTAYAVFRFCIEYLRADSRGTLWFQSLFSPSQLISLLVLIIVLPILLYRIIRWPTQRDNI